MGSRICVDIGSSAVKVLIGQKRGNRFYVEDQVVEKYDATFHPERHLATTLKSILWELDITRGLLHVTIPSSHVLFRYAMFPDVDVREIETVVSAEVHRYIPAGKKDVLVRPMCFVSSGKLKEPILLVGVEKSYLDQIEDIIREIGFRTRFLSVDSLVLANLVSYVHPLSTGPICVVDIGHRYTKIMILKEGKIAFIRSAKIGSFDIDLLIKDRLDVALEVAEAIKKGENAIADVVSLANRILAYFFDEIYISIDFYESQFAEVPEKILLTGGGAKLKGLVEFLSERLSMEVSLFRIPESRIFTYGTDREFWNYEQELMVALGSLLI